MKITEELDAGPIIHQSKIRINQNINSKILSEILSKLRSKVLLDANKKIEKIKQIFKEQDHSKATYAKKIKKMSKN